MTWTTTLTEATTYTLAPLWDRPPLRSNGTQPNRWDRARTVREIRTLVALRAQQQGMHRLGDIRHLAFQLWYAPGVRRRIDPPNYYPTLKPCVDALTTPRRKANPRNGSTPWIGLRIVPDDTPEYVTLLDTQVLFPPEPGPRCWLTVTVTP